MDLPFHDMTIYNPSSNNINVHQNSTIDLTQNSNTTTQNPNTQAQKPTPTNLSNIGLPNELNQFASFTYQFTMYALSDDEVRGATYRRTVPQIIAVQSSGGANIPGGKGLDANDNKFDYFIDNVSIESVIVANRVTKQTNSTKITFEVFEPYSMGQFPLVLMKCAELAKAKNARVNYLTCPYLLVINFVGWDDNGNIVPHEKTARLRRMIPLYINDIKFNVTEKGSSYSLQAIPWNEQGQLYENCSMPIAATIKGRTVKEMCQSGLASVTSAMNGIQARKAEKNPDQKLAQNEYVIVFPQYNEATGEVVPGRDMFADQSNVNNLKNAAASQRIDDYFQASIGNRATLDEIYNANRSSVKSGIRKTQGVSGSRSSLGDTARYYADLPANNNKIGESKMVENLFDPVTLPFMQPVLAEYGVNTNTKKFDRSKIVMQDGIQQISFSSGTTIQEMIEEIIIMSDYGRTLADQEPDSLGFINWFKVELETYPIQSGVTGTTGSDPNLYVYRVVPYKIHKTKFFPPAGTYDYSPLYKNIAKSYNYLYTGKNDAILDFDITYNKSYFVAMSIAYETRAGEQLQYANSRVNNPVKSSKTQKRLDGTGSSTNGYVEVKHRSGPETGVKATAPGEKTGSAVARDFNDMYLDSSVDLINCEMKIMGDPYFIADSGMGNYHSPLQNGQTNITADGTMAYENGEVHIIVQFTAPLDYPYDPNTKNTGDGYMNFPNGSQMVKGFSGVYKVNTVTNNFNEGQFTQTLRMIRQRNQASLDSTDQPNDESLVKDTTIIASQTKQFPQGNYAQGGMFG